MTGFASPNHTQVPNDLFDHLLPFMGLAELKVVLFAIRQTNGYHRGTDAISLSQFIKATGLSRQGVLDGIDQAKERGILAEYARGKRGVLVFRLVYSVDQSTEETSSSLLSRPDTDATGLPSRHTKEKELNKPKESATSEKTGRAAAPNPLYDAIYKVWKFTAGRNGLMAGLLTGTAKAKGWKEYNLETPISAEDLLRWAAWYRRECMHDDPNLTMISSPIKVQSSITDYQQRRKRSEAVPS